MKVFIMQGLPGAGKDWWIINVLPYYVLRGLPGVEDRDRIPDENISLFSDQFHVGEDGVYRFDHRRAPEAHNQCLGDYAEHLIAKGKDLDEVAVVNNTNTTLWEIAPYYRLAESFACPVEIITLLCAPIAAHRRNVHGVPLSTVWQMHQNLTEFRCPSWWKRTVIAAER